MLHTHRQLVRFCGGPADGLEAALCVPDSVATIIPKDYPDAAYSRPDEAGRAHYLGLIVA